MIDAANTAILMKPLIASGQSTSANPNLMGGAWSSTAAITSVQLLWSAGASFDAGTYSVWSQS